MIIILWIYGILLRKIIHVYIKNISRWAQCLIITLLLTLLLRLLPLLLLVFIISRTIVKFLFSAMLFFKKISLFFFFLKKVPSELLWANYAREGASLQEGSLCIGALRNGPLFSVLFACEAGHSILWEKFLADLASRNGEEYGDRFKITICVNRVTDKSALLEFRRATARSVACLGHLRIIRPLFSLCLSSLPNL